jgi:hypothetical protein
MLYKLRCKKEKNDKILKIQGENKNEKRKDQKKDPKQIALSLSSAS